MRYLLILGLLFSTSAMAFEVEKKWDLMFNKYVTVKCEEGQKTCENLCEQKSACDFKEDPCVDCIGDSVPLAFIFEQLGKGYTSSKNVLVEHETFFNFIRTNKFISIDEKSIYNIWSSVSSFQFARQLSELCEHPRARVIVYVDLLPGRYPGRPKYVSCSFGAETKIHPVNQQADLL